MAEISWEKPQSKDAVKPRLIAPGRLKFAIVGAVLIGVIAFLLLSGTISSGRYFITINEVLTRPELAGQTVRVTGAVIGSTIQFDADSKTIRFTVANVSDNPADIDKAGGLGAALHAAVIDPSVRRVDVIVANQAMPDLLKDEAQAIMTGKLGADGIFRADELLLKCPSKYEAQLPAQVSK